MRVRKISVHHSRCLLPGEYVNQIGDGLLQPISRQPVVLARRSVNKGHWLRDLMLFACLGIFPLEEMLEDSGAQLMKSAAMVVRST